MVERFIIFLIFFVYFAEFVVNDASTKHRIRVQVVSLMVAVDRLSRGRG